MHPDESHAMQEVDGPYPDRLLDSIPDPATVRAWLARSIRQAALLRSLLRVAERKAGYRDPAAKPSGGSAGGEQPSAQVTTCPRGDVAAECIYGRFVRRI
jgi:hypothetical protein